MWAKVISNNVEMVYRKPSPIKVDGILYPITIFNDSNKLQELNIYPYTEINTVDTRYYDIGIVDYEIAEDNSVTGTYTKTPKDLDKLKVSMIKEVKSIAANKLAPTDWMVIRATEAGTELDSVISQYRSDIRAASNDKEDAINACESIDDIIAFRNTNYIETHKIIHREVVEGTDEVTITYGPDTHDVTVTHDLVTSIWPTDPNAEEDLTFVSREPL